MKTVFAQSSATPKQSAAHSLQTFPPLEVVTRPTVSTEQAAYYLNLKPQTMRSWACFENGALLPIRINNRLHWPVAGIKALLNGSAQ